MVAILSRGRGVKSEMQYLVALSLRDVLWKNIFVTMKLDLIEHQTITF